jgi:hypothetical protein
MAAIYSNGGNRWNILGFKFTKRDALSSLYKISVFFADHSLSQQTEKKYDQTLEEICKQNDGTGVS